MPLYDDGTKYSVKEASNILGLNPQSLRYYDRIGLLAPFCRDPDNRYRCYTINQFYQLEMFKYAKSLGLQVSEYCSMFITREQVASGDFHEVRETFDRLLDRNLHERELLDRRIAEIEAMRRNLGVLERHRLNGEPFEGDLPVRCAYVVAHDSGTSFEKTSVCMRRTRNKYQNHLTEQYGFLLDVDAAREGRLEITKQYVVLDELFEESEEIVHLPAGTYTCFLYHGFCPEEPLGSLASFLSDRASKLPYLIADEMNFYEEVCEIVHAVRVLG